MKKLKKKQGQSRFYKVSYRFWQDFKTFAALVSKWRWQVLLKLVKMKL